MYHPLEADERCNAQGRMNSRPDVREPPAMLLLMGTLALFWVGCKQPDLLGRLLMGTLSLIESGV